MFLYGVVVVVVVVAAAVVALPALGSHIGPPRRLTTGIQYHIWHSGLELLCLGSG